MIPVFQVPLVPGAADRKEANTVVLPVDQNTTGLPFDKNAKRTQVAVPAETISVEKLDPFQYVNFTPRAAVSK
ncbi:MAG: hypothetical protein AB7K68_15295 [Bacteriovoracia bacterium]